MGHATEAGAVLFRLVSHDSHPRVSWDRFTENSAHMDGVAQSGDHLGASLTNTYRCGEANDEPFTLAGLPGRPLACTNVRARW